jgi:hypothetical protein
MRSLEGGPTRAFCLGDIDLYTGNDPTLSGQHEEVRPYQDNTMLLFRVNPGIDVPDMTGNGSGAAGGTNSNGKALPPVIFPPRIIMIHLLGLAPAGCLAAPDTGQ